MFLKITFQIKNEILYKRILLAKLLLMHFIVTLLTIEII